MALVVAIVISGLVFKKSIFSHYFGYENYPIPAADEFTYVWQAISLKRYGVPMAWTLNAGVYQDKKLQSEMGKVLGFKIDVGHEFDHKPMWAVKEIDYMKGIEHMLFVAPFFDHPPLGGLIYSLGVDKNMANVEEVKPSEFRRPAIIMSFVVAILLFIFLYLITSNPWISTLGIISYLTVPTYILATRTAFLENAVSPFVLSSLILLFLYVKNNSKKYAVLLLIFSGLLGGASVLAKESAIGFLLGGIILLWKNKINIRIILIFIGASLLPVLVYFGWGLWLQKDLFMAILLTNSSRGFFGAIKMVTMLESLKFKNFPTDGWWIWGLISFVLVSLRIKNKNVLFLTLPLFTHLLVVLLMGSGNAPWYWLSMIPFLAGCSAILLGQIFFNPNFVSGILFFLIPFSSSYYWGREALGIAPSINHYRMALLTFCAFLILRIYFSKNILVKFIWIIFMTAMMYKIVIFNDVFFPYLIAHFGNLSILSLPNY